MTATEAGEIVNLILQSKRAVYGWSEAECEGLAADLRDGWRNHRTQCIQYLEGARLRAAEELDVHHAAQYVAPHVFVFGSNLGGRHGRGAALHALQHHGAIYGQGVGRQGNSYAIPTKSAQLHPLALPVIAGHVADFLTYARATPQDTFLVTRIGCGLAGYQPEQIAPMFEGAPANCQMPDWS